MKSFFGINSGVATLAPSLAVSPTTSSSPPAFSAPPEPLLLSSITLPPQPPLTILENQSFLCGPAKELVYTGQCTQIQLIDSRKGPVVFKEEGDAHNQRYLVAHGKGILKARFDTDERFFDEPLIYSGNWAKGVRDGEGEGLIQTHHNRGYHGCWYANSEMLGKDAVIGKYKGEWKKGTLSGRGVLILHNPPPLARLPPNFPELRVTGEFLNDNPWHCIGSLVNPAGDFFSGEWVSGFFSGKSDRIGSGLRYRGEIRNDKKSGSGEEIDPLDGRYIGIFVQDNRHFTGKFIWPSGRVEEREYNNGVLVARTEVDPVLQETLVKQMDEQLKTSVAQVQNLSQELSSAKSQIITLKSVVEKEKEANLCQICFENKRNALIMPCCHFLYCNECLRNHIDRNTNNCPACRTPVGGIMQCKLTL